MASTIFASKAAVRKSSSKIFVAVAELKKIPAITEAAPIIELRIPNIFMVLKRNSYRYTGTLSVHFRFWVLQYNWNWNNIDYWAHELQATIDSYHCHHELSYFFKFPFFVNTKECTILLSTTETKNVNITYILSFSILQNFREWWYIAYP